MTLKVNVNFKSILLRIKILKNGFLVKVSLKKKKVLQSFCPSGIISFNIFPFQHLLHKKCVFEAYPKTISAIHLSEATPVLNTLHFFINCRINH